MPDQHFTPPHGILTVGMLRLMLEGTDDETQITVATDDWYVNIGEVVVPDMTDEGYSDGYQTVVLFHGPDYDSRQ